MDYYVQDSADARLNRQTFIGAGTSPVYTAVLSYKFSEEDDSLPVTLEEAKDWCVIDGTDYDVKVTMLIAAARRKIEKAKCISLVNRTVTARITPGTPLPYGPVIEITSITDNVGSLNDEYGNIYTLSNMPCSKEMTVVYTAGPGEDEVTQDLKIEVLQQVAFMLENRGDDTRGSGGISPMIKGNQNNVGKTRFR